MSDEKPTPVDDLKQGLNLLFRAAKGALEQLPTDKIEAAVKDGAKEVGKAFETVAEEVDKVYVKATSGTSPSAPPTARTTEGAHNGQNATDESKKSAPPGHYDDAYGPEPSGPGPRVG